MIKLKGYSIEAVLAKALVGDVPHYENPEELGLRTNDAIEKRYCKLEVEFHIGCLRKAGSRDLACSKWIPLSIELTREQAAKLMEAAKTYEPDPVAAEDVTLDNDKTSNN